MLATAVATVFALFFALDLPEAVPDDAASVHADESANASSRSAAEVPTTLVADEPQAAWSLPDAGEVDPLRIPPNRQEGGADGVLVALPEAMWWWRVGERVALFIPHTGDTYHTSIERVVTTLGDNRSYVGRLENDERVYRVVITVGAKSAFAHVATPKGIYELVGNREYGWLMPTASMDRHVDYSQPDYILPEYRRLWGEADPERP